MVSIAREILLHDRLRFAITVVSLGFAIVMMVYDVGMFFGVTGDSVNLIDRRRPDDPVGPSTRQRRRHRHPR